MQPKGKGEVEDRSHPSDISRRRRRAAQAREEFYGIKVAADGTEYIDDTGGDSAGEYC